MIACRKDGVRRHVVLVLRCSPKRGWPAQPAHLDGGAAWFNRDLPRRGIFRVGRMITTNQPKEGSEVVGTRTQQTVEIPSPLLLAIKEWQRQLLLKLK